MFAVEVRDHIMIAHSFPSPTFGPAQGVHGATFTVDCAFFAAEMDDESLVVDIGLATEALAETLAPLRYKNLDDIPEFKGKMTTTEFLCKHIFDQMAGTVRAGGLKDGGRVKKLRVLLHESHMARAWYEGDI
ncbi:MULTISPECIES: 6-pyruvoyl trahydropterin synthase family protein [Paracoccus]|jgi:6-pyruvoyl-tetrahydropterin synthase|uniref:6-carboxy-5,6,7,8-tetrahydropterin synthase n=1 Tax=Paracoccus haeundaensis TaxID=225362 RepID=A0A5C4R734_9RHOB|nr:MULTISPECIES: 6-carboxytetrahydropterin synthase [Paracoccus]KIX18739.1 6-pyruvoyl tetrahydropterin synthase [Paracoccus sp. 228]MBF5078614.1 6-carboxytetrahydropterin synthase [Paracoccus sp. NBH48]TNH39823.1 6-carboxytetrahydropterin synthase [Paracoccus haeundaensis]